MGILSLLCVIFFLCTVTDFSAAEKARGVKFCMHFDLLSGQVFSPFGEDWLARSHGGGGITSHMNAPMKLCSDDRCAFLGTNIEPEATVGGHSELVAAASTKAVWWVCVLQAC